MIDTSEYYGGTYPEPDEENERDLVDLMGLCEDYDGWFEDYCKDLGNTETKPMEQAMKELKTIKRRKKNDL